jgi:hypothetical protein
MTKPIHKELIMAIVVLKLPNVKRKTESRPRECRYCEGNTFQRWGQVDKPVKDVRVRKVKVYRYRCCQCKRTFRHYPEGNTSADQTERLRLFAGLLWTLGLSYRASSWLAGAGEFHDDLVRCASGSAESEQKKSIDLLQK